MPLLMPASALSQFTRVVDTLPKKGRFNRTLHSRRSPELLACAVQCFTAYTNNGGAPMTVTVLGSELASLSGPLSMQSRQVVVSLTCASSARMR